LKLGITNHPVPVKAEIESGSACSIPGQRRGGCPSCAGRVDPAGKRFHCLYLLHADDK